MGIEDSRPETLEEEWQPLPSEQNNNNNEQEQNPIIMHSIRNPHITAEKYEIEINNIQNDREIEIYKSRKMNIHNIVAVYDFQVTKAFMGCARNLSCFHVITERITYRLQNFSNLTIEEIVYIFHQSLNGFHQISKYQKICYPTAKMIGIKENAQVKVWLNQNWAHNWYRNAKNNSVCIQSLWNSIQLHAGAYLGIYNLDNQLNFSRPLEFESIMSFIREKYPREIHEGKFILRKRIEKCQFMERYPQPEAMIGRKHIRTRTYSQNLNQSKVQVLPTLSPIRKLNSSLVYTIMDTKFDKKLTNNRSQRVMSKSLVSVSQKSSQNQVNLLKNQAMTMKSNHREDFNLVSPTPCTFQIQGEESGRSSKNRMINFSYEKKSSEQGNESKGRRVKIGQQPTIDAFQLELKLQNVIKKQKQKEQHPSFSQKTINPSQFQKKPHEDEEIISTLRTTEQQRERDRISLPKKAAEQFKYYLRQSLKEKQTFLVQEELQLSGRKKIIQGMVGSNCITERWQEQQSSFNNN